MAKLERTIKNERVIGYQRIAPIEDKITKTINMIRSYCEDITYIINKEVSRYAGLQGVNEWIDF